MNEITPPISSESTIAATKHPIDRLFDRIAWEALPSTKGDTESELPWATHCGILAFPGLNGETVELLVYQLSDGNRVIDAESMEVFLGVYA